MRNLVRDLNETMNTFESSTNISAIFQKAYDAVIKFSTYLLSPALFEMEVMDKDQNQGRSR